MKTAAIVIAIIGVLLYVVINHSVAQETKVVCNGSFFSKGQPLPKQDIYFKFQKYRWWVHLWGDSDGVVYVERSGGLLEVIHDIEIVDGWGDVVFDKVSGVKRGRYSAMSKTMRYVSGGMLFEGKCRAQT